jgi:hypothetical protein
MIMLDSSFEKVNQTCSMHAHSLSMSPKGGKSINNK